MSSLSVAIIALNEEERIRACLESVAWADEIVVVDSGSSDKTVAIAREFTDRVLFHAWTGYGAQKNFALARCQGEWVLSLDADERVPEALRADIATTLAANPAEAGFRIPRQNFFQGAWVRHGGWYPDCQLRLFRRGHGVFTGSAVHESVRVDGPVGRLRTPLVHQSYRGIEDFVARANRYSELAARELAAAGRGGSLADLLLRPAWRFFSMYVLRAGLLDGRRGLVLAVLYAHYVFLRAAKVRELRADRTSGRDGPSRGGSGAAPRAEGARSTPPPGGWGGVGGGGGTPRGPGEPGSRASGEGARSTPPPGGWGGVGGGGGTE